jgi:hypothetical protein
MDPEPDLIQNRNRNRNSSKVGTGTEINSFGSTLPH